MNILAIRRAIEYSPGESNIEKDRLILDAVVRILAARGHQVTTIDEEGFDAHTDEEIRSYALVIHMTRRLRSLIRLERLGIRCLNPARAVTHTATSRETTLLLLDAAGLPLPEWWAYEPEADEMFQCDAHLQRLLPAWIKGMHPKGVHPDAVRRVTSSLEADTRLLWMQAQGFSDVIAMLHIEGDLIKAYCVGGSLFLGDHPDHAALRPSLTALAHRIAAATGLCIFGFDLIRQPDGTMLIIDVNDWPSFSPCRAEAAEAIANLVERNKIP